MNRLIVFLFSILVTQVIYAQSGTLVAQGVGKDMHLVHTVMPKENWYSVGRIYNISPKEIAPYNHLTIDMPLSIGQQLNIPLTNGNFTKSQTKADDEALVPVYQTNHVVGYLKVKAALSSLASKSTGKTVAMKEEVKLITKPETKIKPAEEKKSEPIVEKKSEPIEKSPASNFKGGYFKSQYEPSGKSNSGTAGIFKSTSGWQDGKYYALINNVPVGTIIKVTNSSSDKSVYAKVLGNLADMKENAGLAIRISDAAASELGGEDRFDVGINY